MSNYIVFMIESNKIISLIAEIREKANHLIIQELENQGVTGLAPSHGAIFNSLFHSNGQLKMMDIANLIHKDKSTVTALINKLSALNYVERARCLEDSRVTYIALTPKGEELKPVFSKVSEILLETTFRNFNQEDKDFLMEKLQRISNNF